MKRRGFSLVEIMIAVAILASIMVLVWGSFNQTFRAKRTVEAQLSRYRSARVALDRIVRDLGMAYLAAQVSEVEPYPRTYFEGERKNDIDELRFTYLGHQRLYADSKEADTAAVGYFGAPDPENPGRLNLLRRETRRIQAVRFADNAGETDLLCDDVVRLELSYYHYVRKEWVNTWRTTQADGFPDLLPSRVRIKLVIHDDQGQELNFQTEARIAMHKPVDTSIQGAVQ